LFTASGIICHYYEAAHAAEGTGAAFEMAAIQQEGLAGSGAQLRASLEEILLQISEHLLPHAQRFIEMLGRWVEKFASLDERTQRTIITIAGIAAAVTAGRAAFTAYIASQKALVVSGVGVKTSLAGIKTALAVTKKALIATGIGAAVVAIGVAVAALAAAKQFEENLTGLQNNAIHYRELADSIGYLSFKQW